MGSDVRVMGFSGIPFRSYKDYDVKIAKRRLRALIDDLIEDKKFLLAIGFKKGEVPATRGRIKNEPTVWDYLAPPSGRAGNHHFTIYVHDDKAGAALTIPHGAFAKLRNFVKKHGKAEFEALIRQILTRLERSGIMRNGGLPYITIVQRRYSNLTEVYASDGRVQFDIRTTKGQPRKGKQPPIAAQTAWIDLCEQLIVNRRGNTQFQIGVHFPYSHCKKIDTPEFARLVKDSLVGTMPLLLKLS
jgi:hypothetical protein